MTLRDGVAGYVLRLIFRAAERGFHVSGDRFSTPSAGSGQACAGRGFNSHGSRVYRRHGGGSGSGGSSNAADRLPAATPGVETTIAPAVDPHDTVTYHNIVELVTPGVVADLEWTPTSTSQTKTLKALATNRAFRSTTWYLQFAFKPLRVIQVELPNEQGRLAPKTVWYMVYRVKNIGGHLKPVEKAAADGGLPPAPEVEPVSDPGLYTGIHFFPKFTMEAEIEGQKQVYLDKIIPAAVAAIRKREDPSRPLFNSVEIGSQAVKISTATEDNSVWGVATWVDVDPRIDFFSIYVTGLTNAYRWSDPEGRSRRAMPLPPAASSRTRRCSLTSGGLGTSTGSTKIRSILCAGRQSREASRSGQSSGRRQASPLLPRAELG